EAEQEAEVPLLGGHVLADGRQVEDGNADALLAQPGGGPDHKGALPHLPGSQHVAELPLQQRLVELPIGLALEVGGVAGSQAPPRHVEGSGDRFHQALLQAGGWGGVRVVYRTESLRTVKEVSKGRVFRCWGVQVFRILLLLLLSPPVRKE